MHGQRLEPGSSIVKEIPPQFRSYGEQKFFESIATFKAGFQTDSLVNDTILNSMAAASWQ